MRPFSKYIKREKDHDWFMSLAWAMFETKGDEAQCRMFVKLYAFMREWMPGGPGWQLCSDPRG